MMTKTVFQKIIDRELPANIVLETDRILAFHDIHQEAPVHVLIVPKKLFSRLATVPAEESVLLGELLLGAQTCARILAVESTGYRVIINNGSDGGETVPHLHVHLLGGRSLSWPPG
jgi:histidine triad (HIT) family protein